MSVYLNIRLTGPGERSSPTDRASPLSDLQQLNLGTKPRQLRTIPSTCGALDWHEWHQGVIPHRERFARKHMQPQS
jgi:hypothetical protein